MFIALYGDKHGVDVIDTEDFVEETVTEEYICNLAKTYKEQNNGRFIRICNLDIFPDRVKYNLDPVTYDKTDHFLLVARDFSRMGKRGIAVDVYSKGLDDYYSFDIDDVNHLNFSGFTVEEFGKYFAITLRCVDKHYYKEDAREYFGKIIILERTKTGFRELRHDKSWTVMDYLDCYEMRDGKMITNVQYVV